jgi:glutaminase
LIIFSVTCFFAGKPHNPLLNAGAIMMSAVALNLLHPEMRLAEKFDYLLEYFRVCK